MQGNLFFLAWFLDQIRPDIKGIAHFGGVVALFVIKPNRVFFWFPGLLRHGHGDDVIALDRVRANNAGAMDCDLFIHLVKRLELL